MHYHRNARAACSCQQTAFAAHSDQECAEILGVSRQQLDRPRRRLNVGTMHGRSRHYTSCDVAKLRAATARRIEERIAAAAIACVLERYPMFESIDHLEPRAVVGPCTNGWYLTTVWLGASTYRQVAVLRDASEARLISSFCPRIKTMVQD